LHSLSVRRRELQHLSGADALRDDDPHGGRSSHWHDGCHGRGCHGHRQGCWHGWGCHSHWRGSCYAIAAWSMVAWGVRAATTTVRGMPRHAKATAAWAGSPLHGARHCGCWPLHHHRQGCHHWRLDHHHWRLAWRCEDNSAPAPVMVVRQLICTCGVRHRTYHVSMQRSVDCCALLVHNTIVMDVLGARFVHEGARNVAVPKVSRSETLLTVLTSRHQRCVGCC